MPKRIDWKESGVRPMLVRLCIRRSCLETPAPLTSSRESEPVLGVGETGGGASLAEHQAQTVIRRSL